MSGDFSVNTDWAQWICLVVSSLAPTTDNDKNESSYVFANRVIESRSPDKTLGRSRLCSAAPQRKRNSRPLSAADNKSLLVEAYHGLKSVVHARLGLCAFKM